MAPAAAWLECRAVPGPTTAAILAAISSSVVASTAAIEGHAEEEGGVVPQEGSNCSTFEFCERGPSEHIASAPVRVIFVARRRPRARARWLGAYHIISSISRERLCSKNIRRDRTPASFLQHLISALSRCDAIFRRDAPSFLVAAALWSTKSNRSPPGRPLPANDDLPSLEAANSTPRARQRASGLLPPLPSLSNAWNPYLKT